MKRSVASASNDSWEIPERGGYRPRSGRTLGRVELNGDRSTVPYQTVSTLVGQPTLYDSPPSCFPQPPARLAPNSLSTFSNNPSNSLDSTLTASFSTTRPAQLMVATHLPPSLSTTLTFPSHPPSAIQRPPGAQLAHRIPNPGSSAVDVGENEGEEGVNVVKTGPSGECTYNAYYIWSETVIKVGVGGIAYGDHSVVDRNVFPTWRP